MVIACDFLGLSHWLFGILFSNTLGCTQNSSKFYRSVVIFPHSIVMNGNFGSMPHFWTNSKTGISSQAKDKLSSKEQELSEEVGGAQDTNVDPIWSGDISWKWWLTHIRFKIIKVLSSYIDHLRKRHDLCSHWKPTVIRIFVSADARIILDPW